jgi:carbonic anhydrase
MRMVRHWLFLAFGLALVVAGGVGADEPAQPAPAISPEAALERLKAGHARFLAEKATPQVVDAKLRAQLAKGQAPFAVVLACADSRVSPELIFDQGFGTLFVLRVAGNVTGPDILGSVEYAVDHLRVPLVVVLGHENCGAVKAAIEDEDPEGNLGFLLRQVHVGKHLPADKKEALAAAIKSNVGFHAAELTKRSTILKDFAQSGRLQIATGVFSLSSGQIQWLPVAGKKATPAKN